MIDFFSFFFQKLQEKLDNNGGSGEDHNHHQLFVPSAIQPGHPGGRLPSLNSSESSHFDDKNLAVDEVGSRDGHSLAEEGGKSLNTDTIVLVGSLIVMILIGNKIPDTELMPASHIKPKFKKLN